VGLLSGGNLQCLWEEARWDQGYYWRPIGSDISAFYWCRNQRPWMTLNGVCALSCKSRASFRAPNGNLNEGRLCCQRRRCSPMTVHSDNISFTRIFAVVTWTLDRGVKRQWCNQKRPFSGVSEDTSSASYEMRPILLYGISPLSPFCWPHNTWRSTAIFTITNCVSAIGLYSCRAIYRIFFTSPAKMCGTDSETAIRRILRFRDRIAGLSWRKVAGDTSWSS